MSASCFFFYLDPPCGDSAENLSNINRSCPSDPYTPSPCHSRTSKRKKLDCEKLQEPPNLYWQQKLAEEKQKGLHTDAIKDLPLTEKSGDRTQPDVNHASSLDRKRHRIVYDHFDSTQAVHRHPPSHAATVQHAYFDELYPNSRTGHVVARTPECFTSCPGAEKHHYPSASWESMWDFHKTLDQHTLKDYSVNTCRAIRLPLLEPRQREVFSDFSAPPSRFPLALRQETIYLRGRALPHLHHGNCCRHQLPRPGFLATSYHYESPRVCLKEKESSMTTMSQTASGQFTGSSSWCINAPNDPLRVSLKL